MSHSTPPDAPADARELLDTNIQKTVAISTLRRIRGLVDEYDEQDRRDRRLSRRVVVLGAIALGGLVTAIVLSDAGVLRVLTALLSAFKE